MTSTWPAAVIDPHIHQWNPYNTPRHVTTIARVLRPLPHIPHLVTRIVPQSDREFVGDPNFVLKPYNPADYRRDASELPVTAVVHVEAAWTGNANLDAVDETRWVAALPFGRGDAPALAGIVVHADPRWSDVAAVLDAHIAASPLVRGVRHSASNHPDAAVRNFDESPHALSETAFLRGFAAIADRNLTFESWVYSHQLGDVVTLAREYPDTTFVLDHYGTPVGLFGPRGKHTARSDRERADLLAGWRDDIAAVAALPNVVAKHSGLGMPVLGGQPGQFADLAAPLITHLEQSFGADRTMWASNFPMDKPLHSITASAQILLDVLGSGAVPQKLFHDNAARVYRIGRPEA